MTAWDSVRSGLYRLEANLSGSGALIAANRCLDLQEALAAVSRAGPDSRLVLGRAVQAISRGQVDHGRELIGRAIDSRGPYRCPVV